MKLHCVNCELFMRGDSLNIYLTNVLKSFWFIFFRFLSFRVFLYLKYIIKKVWCLRVMQICFYFSSIQFCVIKFALQIYVITTASSLSTCSIPLLSRFLSFGSRDSRIFPSENPFHSTLWWVCCKTSSGIASSRFCGNSGFSL